MKAIIVLFGMLMPVLLFAAEHQNTGYKPSEGYVPNAETAVKIAEAVWLPIYGKKIYKEKPFKAILKDETWFVTGSLPKGSLGGVAEAEISKDNGCIIKISHSK